MKKISIVAAVAIIGISSLTACNRTYRCSCNTTVTVNDSMINSTTTNREYRTTKADARNKCSSWSQVSVSSHTMIDSFGTHNMVDSTKTTTKCSFE